MKRGEKVVFETDSTDTVVKAVDKIKEGLEDVRAGRFKTTVAKLIEEGDLCPECFMEPVKFTKDGDCSCHLAPPCGACVDSYLACPSCGWRQDDEEANQ